LFVLVLVLDRSVAAFGQRGPRSGGAEKPARILARSVEYEHEYEYEYD